MLNCRPMAIILMQSGRPVILPNACPSDCWQNAVSVRGCSIHVRQTAAMAQWRCNQNVYSKLMVTRLNKGRLFHRCLLTYLPCLPARILMIRRPYSDILAEIRKQAMSVLVGEREGCYLWQLAQSNILRMFVSIKRYVWCDVSDFELDSSDRLIIFKRFYKHTYINRRLNRTYDSYFSTSTYMLV